MTAKPLNFFNASDADLRLQRMVLGNNAPGCFPCGARVQKGHCEPGDTHLEGAWATVRGSITAPDMPCPGYYVEWDDLPGVPVFIAGLKLKEGKLS